MFTEEKWTILYFQYIGYIALRMFTKEKWTILYFRYIVLFWLRNIILWKYLQKLALIVIDYNERY